MTKNAVAATNWHVPQNMADALKFAEIMANSDMVPNEHRRKPGNVIVCMQIAADLGVPLLTTLQNVAVINGKPAIWGDLALALVKRHPECDDVIESYDAKTKTARCEVLRRGKAPVVRFFSEEDAKVAGIHGKGVHKTHPKRMLQMRARGFAIRDSFPDALKGLAIREEVEDIPVTHRVVDNGEMPRGVEAVLNRVRQNGSTESAAATEHHVEPEAADVPDTDVEDAKEAVAVLLKERGENFGEAVMPFLEDWIGRKPSSMDPPTAEEWGVVLERLNAPAAEAGEVPGNYDEVPF